MSDFKFNCPHCQQSLEAPEDMIGETTECPSCKGSIHILKSGELREAQKPAVVDDATVTKKQESVAASAHSGSKERRKIPLLVGFTEKQRDSRYKQAKEKWEKQGWTVVNYFNGGMTQASYIEIERNVERASSNGNACVLANIDKDVSSRDHTSSSEGTSTSAKEWKKVGYGAIVGSILLAISIPMKWEIIYAGDEAMHMTGWIVLLDVIGLFGAAVMQRKATSEQEAKKLSKPVAACAGFAFLYAGYTILVNWSIGDQSFAGMSAGVNNGPGVWLGLVGGIVALASQVRFAPMEKMNLPKKEDNQE